MQWQSVLAIASGLMILSGCGGSADDSGANEGGADEGQTAGGEEMAAQSVADMAWADVPAEQRGQWMAEVVVPAMAPLFQEHDAERYADFGCATCHGDDAQAVGFEMPNGLAPLNPEQIPAMFQSEQPMATFMTQTVWPQMAQLLGEAPFNPETGEGFSCLHCHATAEGDAG